MFNKVDNRAVHFRDPELQAAKSFAGLLIIPLVLIAALFILINVSARKESNRAALGQISNGAQTIADNARNDVTDALVNDSSATSTTDASKSTKRAASTTKPVQTTTTTPGSAATTVPVKNPYQTTQPPTEVLGKTIERGAVGLLAQDFNVICNLAAIPDEQKITQDGDNFVLLGASLDSLVANSYAKAGIARPECFTELAAKKCAVVVFEGSNAVYLYESGAFSMLQTEDEQMLTRSLIHVGTASSELKGLLKPNVKDVDSYIHYSQHKDFVDLYSSAERSRVRLLLNEDGYVSSILAGKESVLNGAQSCA